MEGFIGEGVEGVEGGVDVAVEVGLGEEEVAEEGGDVGGVGCVEGVGLGEEVDGDVFCEDGVSFRVRWDGGCSFTLDEVHGGVWCVILGIVRGGIIELDALKMLGTLVRFKWRASKI